MYGIFPYIHLLDSYGTCRVNMPYIGILWDGNRDFGPVYLGICQGIKKIQPCIPSCQASVVPGLWRVFFDKHTNGEHVPRGTEKTNKGSIIPIGSIYGIYIYYIYLPTFSLKNNDM